MKVFLWIAFLILIAVTIFAVQNSAAPLITIKFLLWEFKTSLVYTVLGSIGLGILFILLFWVPRALRASFRSKKSNHEIPST
ncbi:MAG: LapA family protein [Thermodesulfobacteriota bacterium]